MNGSVPTAETAVEPAAASPVDCERHAKRIPYPDYIDPHHKDWSYLLVIAAVHLVAFLAALPYFFSWTGVLLMIAGIHFFGQGITICYHRLLTHRSFEVPRWLERLWVVIALCNLEDTPAKWVATHRLHHQHSDRQPDPHSPLVNFFWSHVGWLFTRSDKRRNFEVFRRYARDVLDDPFYLFLEKSQYVQLHIYLAHGLLFFAAGYGIGFAAAGTFPAALQYGSSLLVWGVFVRTVCVWHISWSVNSLSHMFGYRSYDTNEDSRNNWLVALLTVGEGWHNNHHHDPSSASNQHRWWEWDISYYEIRMLEWLGLAQGVNRPRHKRDPKAKAPSVSSKNSSTETSSKDEK